MRTDGCGVWLVNCGLGTIWLPAFARLHHVSTVGIRGREPITYMCCPPSPCALISYTTDDAFLGRGRLRMLNFVAVFEVLSSYDSKSPRPTGEAVCSSSFSAESFLKELQFQFQLSCVFCRAGKYTVYLGNYAFES